MVIKSVRTKKVTPADSLSKVLDSALPRLKEGDIVVITSKIISICQGRVVKNDGSIDKEALIRKEADYFIKHPDSRYHVTLTIKNGILIANSGIDESNGGGYFVLWPHDAFGQARLIWNSLQKKYHLKRFGVLVIDSRITPMRWGTLGVGLAWCGFMPLKNYIDEPDVFGRKLRMTKESILDGLAAAANVVMGEGREQTPLAVISEVPFVEFCRNAPTKHDIAALQIRPEDDIFAPLIHSALWQRGAGGKKA